jgi:hypothetical protein
MISGSSSKGWISSGEHRITISPKVGIGGVVGVEVEVTCGVGVKPGSGDAIEEGVRVAVDATEARELDG